MEGKVKYLFVLTLLTAISFTTLAQDTTKNNVSKRDRRNDKRQRIASMVKQEEEGVLSYTKQNGLGIQLRTDGYGAFYEIGRRRTQRWTNTYSIEFTEIKNSNEEKIGGDFFGNSFIYGKINNFYQLKLGFGQQYILGQKGNKNGVAVMGLFQGGLSVGLLKPYYIDVAPGNQQTRSVKYDSPDSILFLSGPILGGSGFTKGWNELKVKPGLYVKAALRFDFGRYNESVEALEIGASVDFYSAKIPIMVYSDQKQLFFQGHIAFIFGRRK